MSRTRRNETNHNEKRNKRRRNDTEKLPREYSKRDIVIGTDEKPFTAKINKLKLTQGQIEYLEALRENTIILVKGLAGTGKTTIAMMKALQDLVDGKCKQIIYTKPIIPVGDSLGFLPKGVDEKIAPFVDFIYEILIKLLPPEKILEIKQKKLIRHEPLQFIRGKTFEDSVIILDEAQNATKEEHDALITRLGLNSKLIMTCCTRQIDLVTLRGRGTGIHELITLIQTWEELHPEGIVKYVELSALDCHRSPLLKEYFKVKEYLEKEKA